jgi:hypothetical protein
MEDRLVNIRVKGIVQNGHLYHSANLSAEIIALARKKATLT